MQHFAPVALFVYNRPDHTRRTIKFLQQNLLADETRLFIFSDGPKSQNDERSVAEVREIIDSVSGFKSVEIFKRKENAGLAESIIEGVSQLVQEYGQVIVFEDDLISSPYTLQYFNDSLKRYKDDEQVMHIGAYMYPLKAPNLPQTFFYRAATSWGWATWKRAWNNFEPDVDKLMSKFDKEKINRFSIDGKMNFWKQMKEFKNGKNNSWAIRWYASIFLKNGLTLNPSKSLIQNIGHDGTGVHSNNEDIYNVILNRYPITEFPSQVSENFAAYYAIRDFLAKRKGNILQRLVRFVAKKIR
ncbi:glycosyltransferase [Pedobacter sp. HMF7647]|uniref:Glycosyltransferase n=1 Tax=Hufsiella arboris TaxID=2695275 RepID=A0A7K1YAP0_9SPHI|nr:glycosyltransferase [Hufsiella arboris]MXV51657.1 glycosyltransferase [Hufsiella arboris]